MGKTLEVILALVMIGAALDFSVSNLGCGRETFDAFLLTRSP